jgi:hypothetical protein
MIFTQLTETIQGIKTVRPAICCLQETQFKDKNTDRLKVQGRGWGYSSVEEHFCLVCMRPLPSTIWVAPSKKERIKKT